MTVKRDFLKQADVIRLRWQYSTSHRLLSSSYFPVVGSDIVHHNCEGKFFAPVGFALHCGMGHTLQLIEVLANEEYSIRAREIVSCRIFMYILRLGQLNQGIAYATTIPQYFRMQQSSDDISSLDFCMYFDKESEGARSSRLYCQGSGTRHCDQIVFNMTCHVTSKKIQTRRVVQYVRPPMLLITYYTPC